MRQFLVGCVGLLAIAAPACAADLPAKAPVYKAAPVLPAWSGWYGGLNAGYGWSSRSTDLLGIDTLLVVPAQVVGSLPTSLGMKVNGFVGGLQLGYNWQFGQTVAGLETDIAYSAMRGSATQVVGVNGIWPPLTTAQENKITWLGTLRPRLGWLVTPTTLLYATGGLAYGGVKASTSIDQPGACPATNVFCSTGSTSRTRLGWTIGAGAETVIASRWSAKLDYLYFDLGSVSYPVISTATFGLGGTEIMRAQARFSGHVVRAGINYKFN